MGIVSNTNFHFFWLLRGHVSGSCLMLASSRRFKLDPCSFYGECASFDSQQMQFIFKPNVTFFTILQRFNYFHTAFKKASLLLTCQIGHKVPYKKYFLSNKNYNTYDGTITLIGLFFDLQKKSNLQRKFCKRCAKPEFHQESWIKLAHFINCRLLWDLTRA